MKIYDLIDEYIECLSNWKELYDLNFRIAEYDLSFNDNYNFLKLREFNNLYQRIYMEIINSLPTEKEQKINYLNAIKSYIKENTGQLLINDLQKEDFELFYSDYKDIFLRVYGDDYELIDDYISDYNIFWKMCSTAVVEFVRSKSFNLKNITNNFIEINDTESISNKIIKIKWNGTKVQLYHVFRQLKNHSGKDSLPLIGNSYTDIAQFIKDNFQGFTETQLRTIIDELERNERPKKNPIDIQL